MKKPSPLKICIVSLNAYGVMSQTDTGHVGGIEVQTPLMAKWFAAYGFDVSLVTWDHGQADGTVIDGVTMVKTCKESDGLPVVRFVWPRWTGLFSALKRADADIYYYNCGDMLLGQMAIWCKRNNRKLVYSVACDQDCLASLPILKPQRERLLYRHGLLNADEIIVQSTRQKALLQEEFGLSSREMPMPCAGFEPKYTATEKVALNSVKRVVWAGRFSREKRFEWLIDIAKLLPGVHFDVLGSKNKSGEYDTALIEQAEGIANITLHGRIPHSEMGEFYSDADLLLNTSIYEGFPNTYLEAWSVGVPLVATIDPDDVVKRYKLGFSGDSVKALAEVIEKALEPDTWVELSTNARNFFTERHAIDKSMTGFAKLFEALADDS